MALPMDPNQMPKNEPPPPCKMAGSPEEQAEAHAKQFIQNVYGAMDSASHANIPFKNESVVCFQKGADDRFQGPSLMPRLVMMHKGERRDLSGLSVQIFPGNSMMCLVTGDMNTAAAAAVSQQQGFAISHRFADFFLVCSEGGPHIRNAVFRELDEDCGPPPPNAVQGEPFAKADAIAKQFVPFFYSSLDDPSKRGGLNSLFKDVSTLTVGKDMFKGAMHIAHKIHFLPQLVQPGARQTEGVDAMPSPANGFFLFVHGKMQLAGEERQCRFIDVFHLMPEGGNFWVSNAFMKVHGGV